MSWRLLLKFYELLCDAVPRPSSGARLGIDIAPASGTVDKEAAFSFFREVEVAGNEGDKSTRSQICSSDIPIDEFQHVPRLHRGDTKIVNIPHCHAPSRC